MNFQCSVQWKLTRLQSIAKKISSYVLQQISISISRNALLAWQQQDKGAEEKQKKSLVFVFYSVLLSLQVRLTSLRQVEVHTP